MFDMEISERLGLSPFTDTNNNSNSDKKGDKYSLRPRSCRKRPHNGEEAPEDVPAVKKSSNGGSRQCKPKQKPAPLSKYRRKTANARERSRMKEINQAFESLRKAVPQMSITHHQTNEKLTKITTLRLAMKYISTLSAALNGGGPESLDGTSLSDYSDLDCLLLESDGESLPLNSTSDFSDEHSLTPADFSLTIDFEDSLTPVDFDRLSVEPVDDMGVMMGDGSLGEFDPFLAGFS